MSHVSDWSALSTLTPPTRNNFVELMELGAGSGGSVWKAIHVPSMKIVALKKVPLHSREKYVVVAGVVIIALSSNSRSSSGSSSGSSSRSAIL